MWYVPICTQLGQNIKTTFCCTIDISKLRLYLLQFVQKSKSFLYIDLSVFGAYCMCRLDIFEFQVYYPRPVIMFRPTLQIFLHYIFYN